MGRPAGPDGGSRPGPTRAFPDRYPGQVRERLRALADAGVGWAFLLFDDLPRLARLRSFAEAVMPALHADGDEGAEPP